MKITQSHLTFWLEKRAPTPTWALTSGVAEKRRSVDVNYLINVQAERYPGSGPRPSTEPGNTMAVLKLHRRYNPSLIPILRRMAANPQVAGELESARRSAFCHRMLRKLGVIGETSL